VKKKDSKKSMLALNFGGRLKKIREARGLTQRDLSDRVGIELVQISRYERGQYLPNAETLASLAQVLDIDLNFLLLGETREERDTSPMKELDIPLLERFQDLQKLSKRDRDAVILLIDSVLARGDVEQRLRRRA
jgi:transcriptional regulator with XRE-family HTH domain